MIAVHGRRTERSDKSVNFFRTRSHDDPSISSDGRHGSKSCTIAFHGFFPLVFQVQPVAELSELWRRWAANGNHDDLFNHNSTVRIVKISYVVCVIA